MDKNNIQLFEDNRIRTAWDEEKEEWLFSIVDVVAVLTDNDYQTARNYWKVTKSRMINEGNQLVTTCNQLKMKANVGKQRLTDVANTEQLARRGGVVAGDARKAIEADTGKPVDVLTIRSVVSMFVILPIRSRSARYIYFISPGSIASNIGGAL